MLDKPITVDTPAGNRLMIMISSNGSYTYKFSMAEGNKLTKIRRWERHMEPGHPDHRPHCHYIDRKKKFFRKPHTTMGVLMEIKDELDESIEVGRMAEMIETKLYEGEGE